MKTIIVYGTRAGASKKSAEVIKDVLESEFNQEVALFNAKNVPKNFIVDDYSNVVVGSSIQATLWARRAKKFLKRKDLAGKKVAVFVSAAGTLDSAGKESKDGGPLRTKEEAIEKALNHYVNKFLGKQVHLDIVAKTALGGWMKVGGGDDYTLYNWNQEDVMKWARELGGLFS